MAGKSENKNFSIEVARGEHVAIPMLDLVRQGSGGGGKGTPEISFTEPQYGTIELTEDALIYTPNEGFAGEDHFIYWVGKSTTPPAGARIATVTVEGGQEEIDGALSGAGQDGYIAGATVWVDNVADGILDMDEPSAVTNGNGDFLLQGENLTGTLYLTGGTDIATGLVFDGVLRAPAGSTVITPITTLVVAVMEADLSLSQEDAEALVASTLGLDPTVDLSNYDPIEVLADPDATPGELQSAEDVFATGSQILNTVSVTGSAVSGASAGTTSTSEAEDNAFSSLASIIIASEASSVDLADTATVEQLVTDTANTALGASYDPIIVTNTALVASSSNTAIDNAVASSDGVDSLTAVTQVSQVAQGATSDAFADGLDPAELDTYTTDLDQQVQAAEVGDVVGQSPDVIIFGTPGNDTLVSGIGNDSLSGEAGDDTLDAGAGDDNVIGGAGQDTIIAGLGNNAYNGGADFDTVDYSAASTGVTANLLTGEVTANGFGGTDSLVDVEKIIGSAFGDTLTGGDEGIQRFEPGDGADTIIGGTGGNDGVDYRTADAGTNTGIDANLLNGVIVDPWGNIDSVSSIERVFGTDFDDTVIGTDEPNEFVIGGDGDDSFTGNGGLDIYIPGPGEDFFDGGEGFDVYWSDLEETQGVEIDLRIDAAEEGTANVLNDGHGSVGRIVNVESIDGGVLADSLIGNDDDNAFYGLLGPDYISGGGGNDFLHGGAPNQFDDDSADILIDGAGSDTLFGGAGADTFIIEGGGDDTIGDFEFFQDFSEKIDLSTHEFFVSPEYIQAQLDAQADEPDSQTFLQLGPNSSLLVTDQFWGETENLSLNQLVLPAEADPDSTITGTDNDDEILGGSGNDIINSLLGNDVVVPGAGNDTVTVGSDSDTTRNTIIAGQGNNTFTADGPGFDTVDYSNAVVGIDVNLLSGDVLVNGFGGFDSLAGFEKIIGSGFEDRLLGANTDTAERFTGEAGIDYIDGGTGVNDGVDHRFSDTGSGIHADLSQNYIDDEYGFRDDVFNIERVYGTIYDDVIIGDDADNQFIGEAGYDVIDGRAGNDWLFSNGPEPEGLIIDLSTGVVTNDGYGFGGEVSNIEGVFGTINDDQIFGSSRDELLVGDAGSDLMSGGAGDDIILAGFFDDEAPDTYIDGAGSDYLGGGPGIDTFMIQGGGNDSIGEFELGTDKIDLTTLPFLVTEAYLTEQINNQDDTDAATFLTFGASTLFVNGSTWQANEELALSDFILPTAIPGDTIDGTDGDDTLAGTNGDDAFNALGNAPNGIDFIIGGPGNDTIDGGDGFDAVDYSTAPTGIFADLENGAIADGYGGIDSVSNVERIIGSAFNDTMLGRFDNQSPVFDRYLPGDGADFIDGRGGNDVVDYREDDTGTGIILNFAFNGQGNGAAIDPYGNFDTILNVSGVFATNYDDQLFGGDENNRLFAYDGNDVVSGFGGDDVLFGGPGFDELRAGEGNDFLVGGSEGDNFVVSNGSAFIRDFNPIEDTIDFRETASPVADYQAVSDSTFEYTQSEDDGQGGQVDVTYVNIVLESINITLRGVAKADLAPTNFQGYQQPADSVIFVGGPDPENFDTTGPIDGDSGNDDLRGGGGDDALRGFSGSDQLYGEAGNDYLEGGTGNDQLFGGEGDFDSLAGGPGDDLLDGGPGSADNADYNSWQFQNQRGVIANLSQRTGINDENGFEVSPGTARDPDFWTDTLVGIENLSGGDYNDWLIGDSGNNFISGWYGDDTLEGMGGGDGFAPGSGSDIIYGDGDDNVDYYDYGGQFANANGIRVNLTDSNWDLEGSGIELAARQAEDPDGFIDSLNGVASVNGTAFDDIMFGGEQDNGFSGQEGNDLLVGFGGGDFLSGGPGFDELRAGEGNDYLVGGSEADNFVVSNGSAFIEDFEPGIDTIDLRETGALIPDLASVQAALTEYTDDDPGSPEFGTVFSEISLPGLTVTLRNVANADLFVNGDPAQGLVASNFTGFDEIDADTNLTGTSADDFFGLFEADPQFDTGTGSDTVAALGGNDRIETGPGDDVIDAGAGDFDSIAAGPGSDTIDGGEGVGDDADFSSWQFASQRGAVVNLSDLNDVTDFDGNPVAPGTARDPDGGLDTISGIENVTGTDYADAIFGTSGDNFIYGGYGDDYITGFGGQDNYAPGSGRDFVDGDGDDGVDYYDYGGQFANANGIRVNLTDFSWDLEGSGIELAGRQAEDPDGFLDDLNGITGINGTAFDDRIFGGEEAQGNGFSGQEGNDLLVGFGGDDFLDGGPGFDELRAGEGNDYLIGGSEGDNFVVSNGSAFIEDFEPGIDTIDFRETATIIPDLQAVQNALTQFNGTEPGDTDTVYSQIDLPGLSITLRNVANADLFVNGDPAQGLVPANFTGFTALDPDQTITGDEFDNNFPDGQLDGGTGNDTINGLGGNDALRGFFGADTLNGGEGDDYLEGGEGNDDLFGQGGDFDSLAGGPGDDLLDGGPGTGDNADYASWQFANQRGVIANLSDRTDFTDFDGNPLGAGEARDPDFWTDTLVGIENLSGTDYGDHLIGDAGDNFLSGWYGDDLLEGLGGNDNYAPGSGRDFVNGDGDDGVDYYDYGGQFANANGIRVNLTDFSSDLEGSGIELAGRQAEDPDGFLDDLNGITGIGGTAFDDRIFGGEEDNGFSGQEGDDLLVGNGGGDFLDGGPGLDTFRPGAGFDTVVGRVDEFDIVDLSDAPGPASVDLELSENQVINDGFGTSDNLIDIDRVRVIGTAGNDTLKGATSQSTLERFVGGPGDDTIDGRGGNDGVDYRFSSSPFGDPGTGDGVVLDLVAGSATDPYLGTDTLSNISRVFGSENTDTLRGDDSFNFISGNSGDDLIEGRGGDDLLVNGSGNATLDGGSGFDILDGGPGDDILIGGPDGDTFQFFGGDGNDTITDFNVAEDAIQLLFGLEVTDTSAADTDGDTVDDALVLTFSDPDASTVTLSGILLDEAENISFI